MADIYSTEEKAAGLAIYEGLTHMVPWEELSADVKDSYCAVARIVLRAAQDARHKEAVKATLDEARKAGFVVLLAGAP